MTNLNETADAGGTKFWDKIETKLMALFLIIAWGVCLLEIFTRAFLGYAYYWTEEFILYFLIWSTFLGASIQLKRRQHIRLSFAVDLLSPAKQRYLNLVIAVIGLVFSIFLAISGFQLVSHAYVSGESSSSLARVPMWIPYSIMPLAGILLFIRFLEQIAIWRRKEGDHK